MVLRFAPPLTPLPSHLQAYSAQMVDNFKEAFACFDVKGHGML
jgi:hypothetical protein